MPITNASTKTTTTHPFYALAPGQSGISTPPDAGGVAWERVDPSTLQVIERLLPAPAHGLLFLALLLRLACVKQDVLPGFSTEEWKNVAVVCTQRILDISKRIGWSYDTTHKYVVIFCALGLLRKIRHGKEIYLLFPLGPYRPSSTILHDLDQLIATCRPKVRQLARNVKERGLLLGIFTSSEQDEPSGIIAALHTLFATLQANKGDSAGALEGRLTRAQQLVGSILGQLLSASNLPGAGDSGKRHAAHLPDAISTLSRIVIASLPEEVDSNAQQEKTGLRNLPCAVDSGRQQRQRSVVESTPQVDSGKRQAAQQAIVKSPQVDSPPVSGNFQIQQEQATTPNLPVRVDSSRTSPAQVVDSIPTQVDSGNTSYVDVITFLKESLTSNVKLAAHFCCNMLGEAASQERVYLKLFHDCEHDASAITAALLFVQVHKHDGTMRNPASIFMARCRQYHRDGIPEEAAFLVKQYGSLTYRQLLDTLEEAVLPVSHPSLQSVVPTYSPPPPLLPVPRPVGLVPKIPLRPGGGMVGEEAQRLRARLSRDRRIGLCRTAIVPLRDGSYVVLVDNTVTSTVRQVAFYTAREWEERSAVLSDCFELFGAGPRGLLAEALKGRGKR